MLDRPLKSLNPRVCDCEYCQAHPSRIISDSAMSVVFSGEGLLINQNGDQLASFYHCNSCNELLAVGCHIEGRFRGAVNSNLLQDKNLLGEVIQIQPRFLNADQKRERWAGLWGNISGL